jgi:hypothetical protein
VITEELERESESAGQAVGDATLIAQYELTGQRIELSLTQYLLAGQITHDHTEVFPALNQPPPHVQLLRLEEPEGE